MEGSDREVGILDLDLALKRVLTSLTVGTIQSGIPPLQGPVGWSGEVQVSVAVWYFAY